MLSRSVVSCSLRTHGLCPTRVICLWNFPVKNVGVACHFLLQATFRLVVIRKRKQAERWSFTEGYRYRHRHLCIGLAKKFIWAFHKMLWEDPNELLGQPNRWWRRRILFFTRSEDFIQLTDTFLLPLSLTRPPVLCSGPSSVLSIPASPGQKLEDGKGTVWTRGIRDWLV